MKAATYTRWWRRRRKVKMSLCQSWFGSARSKRRSGCTLAAVARLLLQQAFLVKDPPHRGLRHSQSLEARHHVPDPTRALFGMLALRFRHRLAPRFCLWTRPGGPCLASAATLLAAPARLLSGSAASSRSPWSAAPRRPAPPPSAGYDALPPPAPPPAETPAPSDAADIPPASSGTIRCRHRSSFSSNRKEAEVLGGFDRISEALCGALSIEPDIAGQQVDGLAPRVRIG